MSVTVTIVNKGINRSSVTYKNFTYGPRTITLQGGQKLSVANTSKEDPDNPGTYIPDNILNLDVTDADIVKTNFAYDPNAIFIKIV